MRYWGEHIFKGVTTPALTFVADKDRRNCETSIYGKDGSQSAGTVVPGEQWVFSESTDLIRSLRRNSFSLGALVGDCGIRTTASKDQIVKLQEAKGKFVPVLEGKRIQRYACGPPEIAVRLDSRKPLHGAGNEDRRRSAAFLIRQTAAFPIVAPHGHAIHFRNSLLALFAPTDGIHANYLVALLNSRLMRFVYMETVREAQQRTFPQVKLAALRSLPLRKLNLDDPEDRVLHDELVQLVDNALATRRREASEKNPIQKEVLQRSFEATDAQIDRHVFALYGLSEEQIHLIDRRLHRLLVRDEHPSWRPQSAKPIGELKKTKPQDAAKRRAVSR